jgi:uncharacterized protein YbaP (TraB family)
VRQGIRARGRGWRAALALALLALPACAGPAAAPRESAAPALWRADASDEQSGTLYLLGSVHVGGAAGYDLGDAVDAAWQRSDELVVEVDLTRTTPQELVSLSRLYGSLAPPLTLADVVSSETLGQLDAYLALRGLDRDAFVQLKPWYISFTIVQVELQLAGYGAEQGVDRLLMERARGHKPIVGLETVASQLETMDRLPASLQELMLKDTLARVDGFPTETARLFDAWRRGDEAQLEALVFQPLDEFPELEVFYDLVFFQRNASMAASLVELGSDGRTRFVVLGAGHMLGQQGVPAQLARRGYRVTRVR